MSSLRKVLFLLGSVVLAVTFLHYSGHILAAAPQAQASREKADFYLATDGNDKWSGRLEAPNAQRNDGPFASFERAQQAVREQKKRNAATTVMVREGTYFLSQPIHFGHEDSGSQSAPVVYQAFPGERVIISGGRHLTGWSNPGGNRWTVKLSSREYQNFEALFFNGERRYRPRTTEGSYLYIKGPVYSAERTPTCSVQPGQNRRRRQGGGAGQGGGGRPGRFGRRFPGGGPPYGGQGRGRAGGGEGGEAGQWECFDRFYYKGDDIASSYHSMALGDVEVIDFEKWIVARLRLARVDTDQHIAYTTGPTFLGPLSGFMQDHRYLIENVQEALKQPGQWYLDRCTDPPGCSSSDGTWTLTYLAKSGENPNTMPVIVPQVSQLIVAKDLQNVVFKNLTFAHDNWYPAPEGLGDFQGGPKVPAALSFINCSHITLDSDVVEHIQAWAVDIASESGTTTGNQVINSAIYDVGYGGIRIGRQGAEGDSDENIPNFTRVENSVIEGLGRIVPSGIGTGVWVGNAHHNVITHNDIYDIYNGAIRIGFKLNFARGAFQAHDNLVSFNKLYDLGQGVTSDMAGIYFASSGTTGNQVLNNVIHDVVHDPGPGGYGGEGLYFDQASANIVAKNNLVYRISQAGLFVNYADAIDGDQPQNNLVSNNIFAYTRMRVLQRGGENENSFVFTHNLVYFDRGTIQAYPGKWSCQGDCTRRFMMDYNVYWSPKGEKPDFITTDLQAHEATHFNFERWQSLGQDTHSIIADPKFVAPAHPKDDFTLRAGSPATQVGFVPFDFKQAGAINPVLRPPRVPPAFPLQVPDPNDF